MRKIIDGSVIVLCLLTVVNTDYSRFDWLDIVVFACMGIALVSVAAYAIMSRRKGK
jgi:uncharacterized membrane protein YbhN (UPF0104 family)